MGNGLKKFARSQLVIPLFALFLLVVFNLIRDPEFFSLTIATNNQGNTVLSGNLISILNGASAVAILSIGMTLVTSSCKGQDISVAAVAAIAGSVFVSVLRSNEITIPIIILAFLFSCVVAVLFSTFNGVLVAVFKIQPMIATLILFSAGRSIAYWINGGQPHCFKSTAIQHWRLYPGYPHTHSNHYYGDFPDFDFTCFKVY